MATAKHRPTLRSQWLGQRLRELREQNHKTLRDVAEFMQRDPSSISRMESGIHPARVPDVLAYLDFCRVSDEDQRNGLVQLAKDSRQSGWWDRYSDQYDSLVDRIWLESQAVEIISFEAMVIPGHLQSRAYAEAVIRAADPRATLQEIERDVELRMQRKERILAKKALALNVILDELVLHRPVGGRAVMSGQLQHLLELTERPKTRIVIIPLEAGAHCSLDGSFDIIRLAAPYPNVAYVYSPAGAIFLERDDVDRLNDRFKRLIALSLSPAGSKERWDLLKGLHDGPFRL